MKTSEKTRKIKQLVVTRNDDDEFRDFIERVGNIAEHYMEKGVTITNVSYPNKNTAVILSIENTVKKDNHK